MKSLSRYSAALLSVIVILSGCAYNPGPNLSGPGKTVPPTRGSAYTFKNTPIDTNGVAQPDSAFFTLDAIVDTGLTYQGKTNVTHVQILNMKTGTVSNTYINFEANGDISVYTGASILSFIGLHLPDWNTSPIQTRLTSGMKDADTNITFNSIPIALKVFDTNTYVGTGSSSVSGNDLAMVKTQHTLAFNGTAAILIPFATSAVTTSSFAPSIGYYTEKVTKPIKSPLPAFPSASGMQSVLVSYHLN